VKPARGERRTKKKKSQSNTAKTRSSHHSHQTTDGDMKDKPAKPCKARGENNNNKHIISPKKNKKPTLEDQNFPYSVLFLVIDFS
jgi:hypothetical protein